MPRTVPDRLRRQRQAYRPAPADRLDLGRAAPPFFVALHPQRGVAQFAQIEQGANQPGVVALVLSVLA